LLVQVSEPWLEAQPEPVQDGEVGLVGRKFIDPDEPEKEQVSKAEAEEEISGEY
jgi:hypothetical protein